MQLNRLQLNYLAKTPSNLERIAKYEIDGDSNLAKTVLKIIDVWEETVDISHLRDKYSIHDELVSVPLYIKKNNRFVKTNLTCMFDGTKIYSKLNPRFDYYSETIYLSTVQKLSSILNTDIKIIKKFNNNFGYYSLLEVYKHKSYNLGISIHWLFHENSFKFNIYFTPDYKSFTVIEPNIELYKYGRIYKSNTRLIKAYETYTKITESALFFNRLIDKKAPINAHTNLLSLYKNSKKLEKTAILKMAGCSNLLEWYIRAVSFINENDASTNKKAISHFESFIFEANKKIMQWL